MYSNYRRYKLQHIMKSINWRKKLIYLRLTKLGILWRILWRKNLRMGSLRRGVRLGMWEKGGRVGRGMSRRRTNSLPRMIVISRIRKIWRRRSLKSIWMGLLKCSYSFRKPTTVTSTVPKADTNYQRRLWVQRRSRFR